MIKALCKKNENLHGAFMFLKTERGNIMRNENIQTVYTTRKPDGERLSLLYRYYSAHYIALMYNVKESTVRSWINKARKAGYIL